MKPIPADKQAYQTTPVFNEHTIPAGLTSHHTTKAGTWGKLNVNHGRLVLQFLDGTGEEHLLTPDQPGFIEPQRPHQVKADGPVEFYVEFYR